MDFVWLSRELGAVSEEAGTADWQMKRLNHVLGDHYTNQMLLIKIAWGGKSLFPELSNWMSPPVKPKGLLAG